MENCTISKEGMVQLPFLFGFGNNSLNMKRKLLLVNLLCVAFCVPSLAQSGQEGKQSADVFKRSAVVKSFRSSMKEKNYGKAREVVHNAIERYEAAANDAQLYQYEQEALDGLVVAENTKIYLNSSPDTVRYFQYIYELYEVGLRCDSLEQVAIQTKQAAGKKIEPKLRKDVGQMMLPYRQNLFSAGKYYYMRKDYVRAFQFLDMYASTKTAAVFLDAKNVSLVNDPDNLTAVSVLAVLSAYASNNYQGVVDYLPESLLDKNKESQLLEIGSKSAAALGDTTLMVRLLEQGFTSYPQTEYFFITLTKYYNDCGDYEKALQKVVAMTQQFPARRDYWYMRGKEQILLGQTDDALLSFEKCVEIKADDAESHSAIGSLYLQRAHEAYAQFSVPLSDASYASQKAAIDGLYNKACIAFEQARKFDENERSLWLSGLKETYFKLNMGKELKALEKYK